MRLFAFLIAFAVVMPFAYDGDMDTYHEAKEELALVRDGYLSALNVAMDDANEGDPEGWFKARDNGECEDWDDLEYVGPELEHFKLTEIPYGFQFKGRHGAYVVDVKIKVVTRDTDIFYDPKSPCTREAVTCIGQYSKGTLGTLKKKKSR